MVVLTVFTMRTYPDEVVLPQNTTTGGAKQPKAPTALGAPAAICPAYCNATRTTRIQMIAVPSTASSSTDLLFKPIGTAWSKPTLSYNERGFVCPPNKIVVEYRNCNLPDVPDNTMQVSCILSKLQYQRKIHDNFNQVKKSGVDIPFTVLRQPGLSVSAQYHVRHFWDAPWATEYPNGTALTNVTVEEWARKAWWRHNLFTKMVGTDARVIWVKTRPALKTPPKEDSDEENQRGKDSQWLQTALERLKQMPAFGLHHRLPETFELFGFRFCVPVAVGYRFRKKRVVSVELHEIVKEHFRLDMLLLSEAELLFDEMVRDMREKQAKGILCDLTALWGEPQFETGLQCK